MASKEAIKRARDKQTAREREVMVIKKIKLHKEKDADIVAYISTLPCTYQSYVTSLIREDMKRKGIETADD